MVICNVSPRAAAINNLCSHTLPRFCSAPAEEIGLVNSDRELQVLTV
jgi:hypothetical protein